MLTARHDDDDDVVHDIYEIYYIYVVYDIYVVYNIYVVYDFNEIKLHLVERQMFWSSR